MKKMIFILTGLALSLQSQAQTVVSKPFTVQFTFSSLTDGTMAYLLYQTNGKKIFDSTTVRKGVISFSGSLEKMIPATVVLDHEKAGLQKLMQQGTLGLDFLKIYLYPGVSEATAASRIHDAVFNHAGVNRDFAALNLAQKEIVDQWALVSLKLVKAVDSDSIKNLRKKYDSLGAARIPVLEKFIVQHPGSLISIVAWEEWKTYKQRTAETSTEELRRLFETLSSDVRSSDEASNARMFFLNSMGLKPGKTAPDFVQPDRSGKNIRLSDFKGKFVLVDFWASWCGPCRANHPALVKLYDDFRSKDFTILGVSLDEQDGRQKWLNAIKKDGLLWPQVSDLKHWDNAVVKLYSVPAIPFSILVNPEGRILQLGGSPDEVRKILAEVTTRQD